MEKIYGAAYVSLHVRSSNIPAIALYKDSLGFEVAKVEKKYCELPLVTEILLRCSFDFGGGM
jgi:ribosomal protein S18 acetylase RimI-like enzyme